MLLVAFSKYTGRAVFDDGSLELLPPGGGELGRREKEAMEEGEDRGRGRRKEGSLPLEGRLISLPLNSY